MIALRFTTTASVSEVRGIAPLAFVDEEQESSLCAFLVDKQDAATVVRQLASGGHSVQPGWPRTFHSSPRAFATASAHIKRS